MKKIISLIMTGLMLGSFITAAYAGSAVDFTPTDVMETKYDAPRGVSKSSI